MQVTHSEEEAKPTIEHGKIVATYAMKNTVCCIKAITPDKILASDQSGDTTILSTDLQELSKLDTGRYGARSVCSFKNILFVGDDRGAHIFDMSKDFEKVEQCDFGDCLRAMAMLKTQDDSKTQFIICGTVWSKLFMVKASDDPEKLK